MEIVSARGERMAQGKYPVVNGVSSGEIGIPADLLSGNYYLRSYTRWMRNRGPETFSYLPLRIINPLRPELENEGEADEDGINLAASSSNSAFLDFKTHPATFGRGDSVTMQIKNPGGDLPETIRGSLSVVPYTARPAYQLWEVKRPEHSGDSTETFQLSFLPDKYGPSLSGSVLFPDGVDEAMSKTRIHLALMGEEAAYYIGRPDASGRFTVALPFRKGGVELFVQPESPAGEALEVRIDQDFDQRELRFRSTSFHLSDQERQMATIMARNIQLYRIFDESDSTMAGGAAGETYPFYGLPTLSVDMDRYVLLPTLEEVFLNLVPNVSPVTRKNLTTLRIQSENPAFSLFDPLIMVDQVPVLDWKEFMSISPAKIARIDVIEDVYVIGNMRFGGLINLQSMENDMAGIDLPGNSFFFDYMAMYPPVMGTEESEVQEEQIPDTRNTLLWLPDLVLEKGALTDISFMVPDYPGEYVVLFRGLDPEGTLFIAETTFSVMP